MLSEKEDHYGEKTKQNTEMASTNEHVNNREGIEKLIKTVVFFIGVGFQTIKINYKKKKKTSNKSVQGRERVTMQCGGNMLLSWDIKHRSRGGSDSKQREK